MKNLVIAIIALLTACTKHTEHNNILTVHGVTHHFSKDSVLLYKHHSFLFTYKTVAETKWAETMTQQILCEADGRYSISYFRIEGETCY